MCKAYSKKQPVQKYYALKKLLQETCYMHILPLTDFSCANFLHIYPYVCIYTHTYICIYFLKVVIRMHAWDALSKAKLDTHT